MKQAQKMSNLTFKTVLNKLSKIVILCIISLMLVFFTGLRHFVLVLAKLLRSDLIEPVDHHFTHLACQVYLEANVAIVVTAIANGELHVENVIQEFKNALKKQEYNKLKQCIVPWNGYLFWKQEQNFNISEHIFVLRHDSTSRHSLEQELLLKPFTPGKSPWAVYVVKNPGGNETLFVKMHHSLADGRSILKLLVNEICKEETSSVLFKLDEMRLNYFQQLWQLNIYPTLRAINWFANTICNGVDPSLTQPGVLVSPIRSGLRKFHSIQSREIPLECLKTARRKLGYIPFVVVIISAVTEALGKFVAKKFSITETMVPSPTCVSPFPLPNHPGGLLNHWSAILLPLPIGNKFGIGSVKQLGNSLNYRLKRGDMLMMRQLTGMFGTLPYKLVNSSGFTDMIGIPVIISEFPGPTKKICGFGTAIENIKFQVGFHKGNCGMMFFGTSYNGKWSIGLNIDEDVGSEIDAKNIVKDIVDFILSYGKTT